MRYFFTFGQNQTLARNYVVVESESYDGARVQMVSAYGTVFAFQYDEASFRGQPAKYGLLEVPFGTPNEHVEYDDS